MADPKGKAKAAPEEPPRVSEPQLNADAWPDERGKPEKFDLPGGGHSRFARDVAPRGLPRSHLMIGPSSHLLSEETGSGCT